MAAETAKSQQGRAINAVLAMGTATPSELADRMNQAVEVYPKLSEIDTAKAKKLLDTLHKQGQLVSAGGSRFKVPDATGPEGL